MKFFIAIDSIAKTRRWFGRSTHSLQLASITIRCENGNVLHRISSEYKTTWLTDYQLNNLQPYLLAAANQKYVHPLKTIKDDVKKFIDTNSVLGSIEFFGFNCSIEATVFRLLFDPNNEGYYPDYFPLVWYDLFTDTIQCMANTTEEDFISSDQFDELPLSSDMRDPYKKFNYLAYNHKRYPPEMGVMDYSENYCRWIENYYMFFMEFCLKLYNVS